MGVKVQRDAFIEQIYENMFNNESIYFVSADFGSPVLDKLRERFSDRFTNVGIAEQNLINISAGLALEGYTVYAYAIAPFLTMRAYEQIRTSLAMLSQVREINVNLIGVGIGLSYDVTGPTHHCLEDLSIMRTLPNMVIFSPSDYVTAESFIDYSLNIRKPKYIRLDGKPLPKIYDNQQISMDEGFCELKKGERICIVSTGYMTHKALNIAGKLMEAGIDIGVIDIFLIKPFTKEYFFEKVGKYKHVLTIEESFVGKGGLDSIVSGILREKRSSIGLTTLGFGDKYVFNVGNREYLHEINGLDEKSIIDIIREIDYSN